MSDDNTLLPNDQYELMDGEDLILLLACPFCGSDPEPNFDAYDLSNNKSIRFFHVACSNEHPDINCGVIGPVCENERDAIDRWNTRYIPIMDEKYIQELDY